MTKNEKLAYLRRQRYELEGFREPTEGDKAAHKAICNQIWTLLTEDNADA